MKALRMGGVCKETEMNSKWINVSKLHEIFNLLVRIYSYSSSHPANYLNNYSFKEENMIIYWMIHPFAMRTNSFCKFIGKENNFYFSSSLMYTEGWNGTKCYHIANSFSCYFYWFLFFWSFDFSLLMHACLTSYDKYFFVSQPEIEFFRKTKGWGWGGRFWDFWLLCWIKINL